MTEQERKIFMEKEKRGEESCLQEGTNNETICLFAQIAEEWMSVKSPQWKASSVIKYTNIINKYLLPEYSQKNITDISRAKIFAFTSKLLLNGGNHKQGLAPKTVNGIISVMKNIFEYAAENKGYELISFKGMNTRQVQKPMRILSMAEQQTLSEYLLAHQDCTNLGILISLYTGLRIGEICALKWEDISFKDKCIHIHKTMQRLQTNDNLEQKTKIIISTPKSDCSIRDVPIPDNLFLLMKKHQNSPSTYILTGSANFCIEPRTMQNRFKAVIQKSGITKANFHALRHTFATRCVELGFDLKSLSEILGHASVTITLNRYVHPSMELKQKNMDMLSELLVVK